jgi:hypothetical protein
VLDRFLPEFLRSDPSLSRVQRRAIWAITHCRTPAMGGSRYACAGCKTDHFAFHSCNHKACPRCGKAATAAWVERGLEKLVHAPYFMVTFTLPQELRSCFFGPQAKEFYDLFFAAVSAAMTEKLATAKGLKAVVSGFIAVLHTWGQQMQFHPHIHLLVPGAGINAKGQVVRVKQEKYLVHLPLLQAAFRQHFRRLLTAKDWQVDPAVWTKSWGVHIQPAGSGSHALRYLGAYVARSVIGDKRIVSFTDKTVTFLWKDRDEKCFKERTLTDREFVTLYLRHVLPRGLRSIRYYGFLHPAAVRNRERVRLFTGSPILFGPRPNPLPVGIPACPSCKKDMTHVARLPRAWFNRGPPGTDSPPYFP